MQLVKGGVCGAGELPDDGGRPDVLGIEMDAEDVVVPSVGGSLGPALVPVAVAPVLLLAILGTVGVCFAASTLQRACVGAAGAAARPNWIGRTL